MGGGSDATVNPFRRELERWKAVGGGPDRQGNILHAPWPLQKARIIDSLCQRYSCLPSQLLMEDMDLIFQMHTTLYLAGDHDEGSEGTTMKSTAQNLANISTSL